MHGVGTTKLIFYQLSLFEYPILAHAMEKISEIQKFWTISAHMLMLDR